MRIDKFIADYEAVSLLLFRLSRHDPTHLKGLWKHLSPNAKSLVETRLAGRLHIDSNILVAGA
jgi:hypothetical protein